MNIELLHQPESAIARISLDSGEELVAQAGAMIAMSGSINASTTLRKGKGGGVMGGLKRMVAGESLFLSVFRSPTDGNTIWLAPKLIGDLLIYEMKGQDLIVQATSYLACSSEVDLDVDGEYIVDTGHIVAFERSLNFSIAKASSSLIGSFLGGEGFVCRFKGKGKVFCQTHNPGAFGSTVGSKLPPR
jgi:uncharacterized protein (AIM24 family)